MSYDPTREWTIAATDLTLPNNNFHWLYVKAPIDPAETTAVIVASETHIDALPEDGYIYYKIGFAAPVADGVRELHTLWGASRPGSGGGTDDKKVKYDAADPTAGYLSEKIVAGANITIEEGTGADENKVKISATGGGSITYLGLTDTSDTTYTDKDKHVPMVNETTGNLDLTGTEVSAVIHVGTTPPADTTKLWYDIN